MKTPPIISPNKAPSIVLGSWEQLREEASKIRIAVFVNEQHVPLELEFDEFDASSSHVVVYSEKGEGMATARLLAEGYIGRMAVLPAYRGMGLGADMLKTLMAKATEKGLEQVKLSAQTHAIGFYEKYGFVAVGDMYRDAGIDHQLMHCTLSR